MRYFALLVLSLILCSGCTTEQQRRGQERQAYAYWTSENCLDPQWFKSSIKNGLANEEGLRRGTPQGLLFLCTATIRMLGLAILLYPATVFAAVRLNDSPKIGAVELFSTASIFVLWFLLAWPVKIVLNLGAFVLTGEDVYFSYPFLLFCIVGITLIGVLIISFEPVLAAVREGIGLKKTLGILGITLEIAGIVFTIRDIVRLFL